MGPRERQAREAVRRHAHRTNPASLRLARVVVELARRADAAVEKPTGGDGDRLRVALDYLGECEAVESPGDVLRADAVGLGVREPVSRRARKRDPVSHVLDHLRDCEAEQCVLDEIRARRAERQARQVDALPEPVQCYWNVPAGIPPPPMSG